MYISLFIIQILNVALASLDCSTIKGTALSSYAYKTDGSVQFEFPISASGNVDITFPTFWSGSPSISPLISGTTTCRETTQSITCTQNNQKFTCVSLAAGSLIIKCSNVKGPHTNKPIGNFNIQFAEQSCDNIQISNFQPYGGSVVFSSNSTTGLFPNTDKLQMIWENIMLPITFSANPLIEVSILSNGEFVTTSTVKGYVSTVSIGLLEALTVSTPSLIKAQMPSAIAVKDVSIKLYMEALKVMGNTQPIQSQIDFKDSNDVLQYQILFPSISVQNDQLTASLSIDSTEINIYTKYTFGVTIKNALNSAGFVRIALAQTLLSSNLICYCDNSVAIPVVNADYIDIGGCLTTVGTHNIAIQNVLNPISTISTITIQYIQTMQNGFSVDKMTNFQYKTPSFTPGTLNAQYERQGSSLDIVGDYSYFTLKITPKNSIPASGTLRMEIPQEIKFVNQNTQTCNIDSNGCQITTIQDQVLVFKIQSSLEASKQFIINSISIQIRNPFDTSQTNYFKFTSYDQFNNIIDKISNVQGYSVNTRSSFDGLVIIESDQPFKNGYSNTFQFTIKTKTPQFYPIQMTVKVGDLMINNNPLCKLQGAVIKTCTKISSNQLDVLIESTDQVLLPTTLKLTVSTIKCKDTMTKSQDFEFSTKSTNGLMSYQQGPYISNSQYGDITQTELIVDKQYYGAQNAVYQFNFALQNGLIEGTYQIHILFPFNLPSSGYSCKDTSNNKLDCSVQSNNILVITGPFDSNQLQYNVIVNGIATPQNEQQPRTFTIKTYRKIDNTNYLVDSSVNGAFQFNLFCPQLNNCRTCKIITSDNLQCQTCYPSIISKYIYMKSNACVDSCGDGYYQNEQEYSCQQCPNHCQTCSPINNILICDKCFDTYKYQDSVCVDTCGETYYLPLNSNNKCEKCDSECILCSMNSSYCSKCQPNIPLYDHKCYSKGCEEGYYQTYNSSKVLVCELCPATCISCITNDQCTECQPGQYSLSGTCRADCPSGYFINEEQMQCKSCISGCSQCPDDKTCVKCSDGFLLKLSQCVLTCGDQYYVDADQTSCLKCNSSCQTCELKDGQQLCSSCIKPYFFSNFTCIQQCQSNYYAVNQECFQCSSNCLTCNGSAQTCTSCQVQGTTPQFLDGTVCVTKCSDTYFGDVTSGKCIQCPSTCAVCTSLNNCTQCNQSTSTHYLIEGACKEECPNSYQPKGLLCELIPQEVITNMGPNRYVPVPHVILFTFFTISVLVSKQYRNETYMPGSILGLNAPLIWSSWLTVLFLLHDYYEYNDMYYFWILVGSVVLNWLFNVAHLLLVKQKIWSDQDFMRWQASTLKNKITNYILISLSLILAYPLYKLIMSRYFGFTFFKAKMVDIKPFFSFNCLNGLYITLVNIPIIVSCALIAYYENSFNSQTFISAIDSLIVTFSNILLLIWETQKGEQFFDEFVQNYYLNESKQNIERQEISGFFQHPFDLKSQAEQKIDISDLDAQAVNQENDITKQKSHEQSQEQSCNLNGISVILSDKNSNPVFHQESDRSQQFPQKQVVPSNLKHTVYYKTVQNNQFENPDDEPPYASPGSENFSSVKSQSSQHCQNSFNDQSQSPLKDISQIQDSEEPHENSQLSIFDEEKNKSPSKQQKTLQLQKIQDYPPDHYNIVPTFENEYDNENDPQQINQQVEKADSFCKKNQSQLSNNQGDNNLPSNRKSSQSRRELAKSAQFANEGNRALQSHQSNSRESLSVQTNLAQQGQYTQQVSNQDKPLTQSFVYQQKGIDQQQYIQQLQQQQQQQQQQNQQQQKYFIESFQKQSINSKSDDFNQIHKQNIDDYPSIPSNQFKPKTKLNDLREPSHENNQDDDSDNIQLQLGIPDQQPQFDTEESKDQHRIQILMDSRAIEEEEDQEIFQDQIQIQKIKPKPYQMKVENRQKKAKREQISKEKIDKEGQIKNIFDSNDSIHTMSDQEWQENQISPSEFNQLNQRFEEEQASDFQIRLPTQSKTQQNYRQAKVKPLEFEFGDENNDEQSYSGQAQVDFTKNFQVKKESKQQQLEKVYLQKLEKNEKVGGRSNKLEFKKKQQVNKNHPKDISDAYIDDQIDVEDINF
ncbi:unnamed protein product (macronuclear) [Paramecium tetraurelia]|uniref:TNFR-Cys domain-containing protein n=1 Tax=Paramecium tetraurelia TaxID=5888 RepID=A0BRV0_PARTE|nr:uncharacterized protein GSPATT00031498001 [Paramecium tetraurelia]CAK61267.1 unnamed protein product [Paramecium tetraurelia]|eukprot:XP_001428665.1 hypothetical protein (macronuclear) [Paramecium tetraurelia strain d4-2]